MAADTIRPGKLPEQSIQTQGVAFHCRVQLCIGTFHVGLGHDSRAAVTWACNKHDVQIVLPDQAIQMGIEQVQPGRCTPVAQQPGLDVAQVQGHF
ncbi:hypothetical protein D3C81_2066810 [compost metagenome]